MSDNPTLWVAERLSEKSKALGARPASRADLLAALPNAGLTAHRFCAVHGAVYYEKGSTWCKLHRVYYDNGVIVPRDCVPTTMWMERR